MKKSNKKSQKKKPVKDKIEEMQNKDTNRSDKPRRERMFMDQKNMNEEFTKYYYRQGRPHRHQDERFAPSHEVAHHRDEQRHDYRRMQVGEHVRPHRRPGRGHFFYEERSHTRNGGAHSRRVEDHRSQDWQHRDHQLHRHWGDKDRTAMLLCEKQRLERRLHHMRRRLHAVNRQLHAQIG